MALHRELGEADVDRGPWPRGGGPWGGGGEAWEEPEGETPRASRGLREQSCVLRRVGKADRLALRVPGMWGGRRVTVPCSLPETQT